MKRFALQALIGLPTFAIAIGFAYLIPGVQGLKFEVTGLAWLPFFGSVALITIGLYYFWNLLDVLIRVKNSPAAAFISRVVSWAVTLPVACLVAGFLFPDNVSCSAPWAGVALLTLAGLASATCDVLEARFLPKVQPKQTKKSES